MEGTAARANCLDASALVKLVVAEPRSDMLQDYLAKESTWYTTPFCFYEALGVLKRKMLKREFTDEKYRKTAFDLMAEYHGGSKFLPDLDLTEVATFTDVKNICEKYPKMDLSDAFQILSLEKGYYSPLVGESQAVLVTDDRKLACVATDRCLKVWYLPDDPPI